MIKVAMFNHGTGWLSVTVVPLISAMVVPVWMLNPVTIMPTAKSAADATVSVVLLVFNVASFTALLEAVALALIVTVLPLMLDTVVPDGMPKF